MQSVFLFYLEAEWSTIVVHIIAIDRCTVILAPCGNCTLKFDVWMFTNPLWGVVFLSFRNELIWFRHRFNYHIHYLTLSIKNCNIIQCSFWIPGNDVKTDITVCQVLFSMKRVKIFFSSFKNAVNVEKCLWKCIIYCPPGSLFQLLQYKKKCTEYEDNLRYKDLLDRDTERKVTT